MIITKQNRDAGLLAAKAETALGGQIRIGLAHYPQDAIFAEDLIELADRKRRAWAGALPWKRQAARSSTRRPRRKSDLLQEGRGRPIQRLLTRQPR